MVSGRSTFELSLIGLPVSRVSMRASSLAFASIRSANFRSTFLRYFGAAFNHDPASKVRRAALTVSSTSASSHSLTSVSVFSVAGLMVKKTLPERAGRYLSLM